MGKNAVILITTSFGVLFILSIGAFVMNPICSSEVKDEGWRNILTDLCLMFTSLSQLIEHVINSF